MPCGVVLAVPVPVRPTSRSNSVTICCVMSGLLLTTWELN